MTNNSNYNYRHLLGFTSFKDLGTTLIILNQPTLVLSIVAIVTTFITNYIYDSAEAVYFLVFLLFADFFTGVINAIKNKEFMSSKLQRIAAALTLYPFILCMCFNMAKYSSVYSFLPATAYALFIGTLATSIFENLVKLKLIDGKILIQLKEKIKEIISLKKNDEQEGEKTNV